MHLIWEYYLRGTKDLYIFYWRFIDSPASLREPRENSIILEEIYSYYNYLVFIFRNSVDKAFTFEKSKGSDRIKSGNIMVIIIYYLVFNIFLKSLYFFSRNLPNVNQKNFLFSWT